MLTQEAGFVIVGLVLLAVVVGYIGGKALHS